VALVDLSLLALFNLTGAIEHFIDGQEWLTGTFCACVCHLSAERFHRFERKNWISRGATTNLSLLCSHGSVARERSDGV
jgi:hypothetical protein